MDFDYLSDTERDILWAVSVRGSLTEAGLRERVPHPRLPAFLHGLTQLGYLRRDGEDYAIGNYFFETWLRERSPAEWEKESSITDESTLRVYSGGERYFPPMPFCFKIGVPGCPKNVTPDPQRVFVGLPQDDRFNDVREYGILPALEACGLSAWLPDERIGNLDAMCKVCESIQSARYAILNVSTLDPDVLFELGLAYGLGREVVIVKERDGELPTKLLGLECIDYANAGDLREKLIQFFTDRRKR
jgi:hypothetical protein